MVGCGNQFFIVRFAHGLLPALQLARVLHRRCLYNFDLYLYSRPHLELHPCPGDKVYSRPRGRAGERSVILPPVRGAVKIFPKT